MQKFSIPQEVQREDRIFGPLTMRRLIILCIGGGLTYVIYLWLRPYGMSVWFTPIFLGSLITLALAFLELFGMRFEKLFLRFLEFVLIPRQRVWDKRNSGKVFFEYITSFGDQKPMEQKKTDLLQDAWHEKQQKLKVLEHPLSV